MFLMVQKMSILVNYEYELHFIQKPLFTQKPRPFRIKDIKKTNIDVLMSRSISKKLTGTFAESLKFHKFYLSK